MREHDVASMQIKAQGLDILACLQKVNKHGIRVGLGKQWYPAKANEIPVNQIALDLFALLVSSKTSQRESDTSKKTVFHYSVKFCCETC